MDEQTGYKFLSNNTSRTLGLTPSITIKQQTRSYLEGNIEVTMALLANEKLNRDIPLSFKLSGKAASEVRIQDGPKSFLKDRSEFNLVLQLSDNDEIDGDRDLNIVISALDGSMKDLEASFLIVDDDFPDATTPCRDSLEMFAELVRPNLQSCTQCHGGVTPAGNLNLDSSSDEILCTNLRSAEVLNFKNPRESDFIRKPLNEIPHSGGQRLNSDAVAGIEKWILKEAKPNEEDLYIPRPLTPENGSEFPAGEGTSVGFDGTLYATGFVERRRIVRVNPSSGLVESFFDGNQANGTRVTLENQLYYVSPNGLHLGFIDISGNLPEEIGRVSLAGNGTHRPNDLTVTTKGIVYVSGPNGFGPDARGMIFMYDVANSALTRLTLSDNPNDPFTIAGAVNGIDISPDEKTLYVNTYNNQGTGNKIFSYEIEANGTVNPNTRKLFIDLDQALNGEVCGSDGMRFDRIMNNNGKVEGNLWLACTISGYKKVLQISPAGEVIRKVDIPLNQVRNVAFGGPDGRTLYVIGLNPDDGFGNIVQLRVGHPGSAWFHKEVKRLQDQQP